MCTQVKRYIELIRDNKDLIWMFAGMIAAIFLYINERESTQQNIIDFKEFMKGAQKVQVEQTQTLKEVSLRLGALEQNFKTLPN